jgi:mono/diheme cytochrome c family protein
MKPFGFAIAVVAALAAAMPPTAVAGDRVDFARDIRPILSANCFKCHGPDDSQRQADLRLDMQDGAFADRDGHFALVAGKADESEVWKRITSADPDERMPPADSGKTLTEAQIALIRQWIDEGAVWSQHWAFVPPQRPAVAAFVDPAARAWIHNSIDAFVLARLQREGLQPAAQAEAVTLLRRLSLDLVGLPPSIGDVDAFLADTARATADGTRDGFQAVYDRQVDRLLDSPHYGERWGRLWLDAARYADSDGYEKDKPRQVWAYRDWVIAALNRDLSYDRFIIEQIAGDLLPDAGQDQLVATGFLRNSMLNEEGGIDPEQFRMEAMFDRMDAIGKSVLGLTIQCAQCHSHKFDPLTQEEYYRMFALLNDCHEANAAVYTPQQQLERAEIVRRIGEIEDDLRHRAPDWPQRMAEWESSARTNQPEWIVVQPQVDPDSSGGQKYIPLDDGSLLCQGYAPTKHRAKLTIKTDVQNITAFRLELLNHNDLPLGGPGRSIEGTAALTEFAVEAAPADRPQEVTKVKLVKATSDVNLPEMPLKVIYDDRSGRSRVTGSVAMALDEKDETAWSIDAGPGRRNQARKAVFNAENPIANAAGTILTSYLTENHGGWNSDDNQNHNLGRFRLSVTSAADAVADPLPATVREALSIPGEQRTSAQTAAMFSYWRTTVPEWQEANAKIEELWRGHPEGASQLVLVARDQPRETHMLVRGDFLKPDKAVSPGVPAFLHTLAGDAPATRLSFAQWLVDRRSPTTARALVNRVWQSYFGVGLVSTSEDLGSQSEAPSHPDLLDWLAVEFMERGWSLKTLHKLIVTSNTYRQSARVSPELHARDPYNRLLARGPRLRVEAETVRDIALAASGLLNEKLGGPSVYPPAPDFLFQPPVSYGPKVWRGAAGDERYRRALYTFRYRSVPYPALQTFDAPNGDFSCVRRVRSNTPLQALVTLNEPLFLECAQALALRTLREAGANDEARLSHAFRRCLARAPDEIERQELLALLARETKHFAEGWVNPKETAYANPAEPPELPAGTTPTQLAAWTTVARVLLNLDETITKE